MPIGISLNRAVQGVTQARYRRPRSRTEQQVSLLRIARVESPLIGVDLADHGYIELLFVENWRYEFGAPDAMRSALTDRLGMSSTRSKTYEFGEMISAVRAEHTYILFMEIIRTVK
jgi:hypothetical protein